jgi:hypothetical protein
MLSRVVCVQDTMDYVFTFIFISCSCHCFLERLSIQDVNYEDPNYVTTT